MAAQRAAADPFDKTEVYSKQLKQLADIRQLYKDTAMASGDWHVQTVKTVSASQRLTEQIQKQKVTVAQAAKEYSKFRKGQQGALSEAIKEQTALRHAMTGQMTAHTFGKNEVDLITPKHITPELEKARVKYGMINELIGAAAHNTVNWGKNTQWAGRQITVGMTMPLGMAAAAGAALAFQIDKELTNIARVYDTTATTAAGKEAELMQLRETSLNAATQMTKEYGVAAKDVLSIQSQLAATGLNGTELQQYTQETMRIATLGDFDPTMAADMTVSLTTAFRDQVQTVDDLAEVYNYYNVLAQETSVQMEDMAAMIPRAASALSALGVSAQEAGVLMTAMRESGVDPEVGANALKSATSTLLDPTAEAINFWKDTLHKDLPAIVKESGGNLYEIIKKIGEELHGLDPQMVQTAVTKTFGKYQFDRATALISNFGDAMTGTANQTATAMDLLGESASSMAEKSAKELDQLQQSVSFKFKAAFEGVKNALIPLGMATLNVLTPILEFASKLVDGFNGLSGPIKNFMIVLGVGAALVGPLLMLIGIFANLMGNVVKFGSNMRNLVIRFKAVNAEEAAAEIMAKNVTSAFDNEARSTALLTQKVQALTKAFQDNAVAQGLMAGPDGTIGSVGKDGTRNTRKIITDKDGNYRYEKGSRSEDGTPLGGRRVKDSHPDVIAYRDAEKASKAIAENAGETDKKVRNTGRNIGALAGIGMMAFGTMATSSDAINDKWMNIAMVAGTAFMMFPNVFSGVGGALTKILDKVKLIGPTLNRSTGGFRANFSTMVNSARPLDTLKTIAPQFTKIAGTALRVFGPVGILAGGALILRDIVGDMHQVAADSKAMASTAESWSSSLGYSYMPGKLPGMSDEDVSTSQKAAQLAKEMSENVDGLGESFARVSDKGDAWSRAMQQALKVVTTGGTVEQARQAFEASLKMMDIDSITMKQLLVRFDTVDLADPKKLRDEIRRQIQGVLDEDLDLDLKVDPSDDAEGVGESIGTWFEEKVGGDLSGAAEAMGQDLGDALATGLASAGDDVHLSADYFQTAKQEADDIFSDIFNDIAKNDKASEVFKELGIKGIDDLYAAMQKRSQMRRDGKELTGAWADFNDLILDPELSDAFTDVDGKYEQFLDNFIDGMGYSEAKSEALREAINSIGETGQRVLGKGAMPTQPIEEAEAAYTYAMDEMARHGIKQSDASALATLNIYRLRAGLDPATDVAQGFGDAIEGSANAVDGLSAAIAGVPDANGIITYNQDNFQELVDSRKQIMQGASSDIMAEASRQFDAARSAVIDNLQAEKDAIDEAYDAEEKAQDAHFEAQEKAADDYWDGRTKAAEDSWDAQEEAAEDAADAEDKAFDARIDKLDDLIEAEQKAYDARIQAVQDAIDAEQEAENQRQRIFEAEQQRIDRMAERLNSNIDFNVALNSGDLDQAARISNDVSSREQTWMNEDARDALSLASEERIEALEQQIEGLEAQRDQRIADLEQQQEALRVEQETRRAWHQERLDQIRESRDVAMEALKAEEEAARENLRISRQIADEQLNARREGSRKAKEAEIKSQQDQTEADKRGLADRLRALQEFIPTNEAELQQHAADVAALYAEYGVTLKNEGGSWAGIVGKALDDNVDVAATQLQTSINWKGIAANIAGQIGEGLGMTMGQVTDFLRTGTLPPGPVNTAPLVTPTPAGGALYTNGRNNNGYMGAGGNRIGGFGAFHVGGEIGGSGGASQKSRTGVPRSASPYPSEELIIAKKGEFMVNAKAARGNKSLLETINSGGDPNEVGGPIGGLAGFATSLASMHMLSALSVASVAARGKLEQAIAARDAAAAAAAYGGGSTGTIAGGNAPWERLWNTIKGAFPNAKLNDAYSPRPGYHGKGMAVDLGLAGVAGGAGNSYMAAMNRWIYDNFRGSTELIYNGLGDDRPNLKDGRDYAYSPGTQAEHRNHVHWAMTPEAIAAAGVRIASGGISAPAGPAGSVRAIVQAEAAKRGWGSGPQWNSLDWLIAHESSWNPNAQNPTSTAYGLFQFLNSTWAGAGVSKSSDPRIQAIGGMNYIASRYGNPAGAQAFWQRNHWYDDGGYLQPGNTLAMNATRKPEPVFTGPQWDILKANIGNATFDVPGARGAVMPVKIVDNVASGENNQYNVTVDLRGAYIKEEIDIQTAVEKAIDAREARNGRRRVIGG